MKAILSTLVLVGISSAAFADTRHPWPERDHQSDRDRSDRRDRGPRVDHRYDQRHDQRYARDVRWERGRYVPRETWRYERPVRYNYGYFARPVVFRPFGQTYVFANQSTFVDSVMVTYNDGRVQTVPVNRYLDPAAIVDTLNIDRDCASQVTVFSRDSYGRSYSFAAL